MKNEIVTLLTTILKDLGVENIVPDVASTENFLHGDYATTVAMKLAKVLKKPPLEIAGEIEIKIKEHQKKSGGKWLQDVKVVPPGFINFFLTDDTVISQVSRVLQEEGAYGRPKTKVFPHEDIGDSVGKLHFDKNVGDSAEKISQKEPIKQSKNSSATGVNPRTIAESSNIYKSRTDAPKKVMVEFTDPNPFKEFHVGHLYTNAVGESFARILEFAGCDVRRANYQGDVGMHVAKSIWGMKKKMTNDQFPMSTIEKLNLKEKIKFLGQAYAMGATAYEDQSPDGQNAKEEMKDINYYVYIAGQEHLVQSVGWKPQVEYRQYVAFDEKTYQEIKELYDKGRAWSLEYFETIYKRLGTKFDRYYFESEVGEYGFKFVQDHVGKGIFEKSDGAIVFRGEKFGLHTRVFVNKFGLPTYEAKDLGLATTKHKDFPYDLSISVTGKEIDEYFKVILAALFTINPDIGRKVRHISHGMVRLPEGKMSSRTGNVKTGEGLIDAVKAKVYDVLKDNHIDYPEGQQDQIAEAVAIASIKYSFLKVALPADLIFDIEKSVSFEGDSGPYLLYTYARCKSVLRKSQIQMTNDQQGEKLSDRTLNDEERAVARQIAYFPDVVEEAIARLSPSTICTYLFTLAQQFNLFYAKHSILGENVSSVKYQVSSVKKSKDVTHDTLTRDTVSFRLSLTAATAQVIKTGLHLLGIETIEQM